MNLVTPQILAADLASRSCRCGGHKGVRHLLCRDCFQKLPNQMRNAVAHSTREGGGAAAYTNALVFLRLPIPTEPMPERKGFTFKPDAPHA